MLAGETVHLNVAGVKALITAVGDTLVALIGGAFVLIGGIWTHALTRLREQQLEQQRDMHRNYRRLLDNIEKVIRNPEVSSDDFSKVHLESWMVGSEDVIRNTQLLIKARDKRARKKALKELVFAMRRDVGLPVVKGVELRDVFLKRNEGDLEDD